MPPVYYMVNEWSIVISSELHLHDNELTFCVQPCPPAGLFWRLLSALGQRDAPAAMPLHRLWLCLRTCWCFTSGQSLWWRLFITGSVVVSFRDSQRVFSKFARLPSVLQHWSLTYCFLTRELLNPLALAIWLTKFIAFNVVVRLMPLV